MVKRIFWTVCGLLLVGTVFGMWADWHDNSIGMIDHEPWPTVTAVPTATTVPTPTMMAAPAAGTTSAQTEAQLQAPPATAMPLSPTPTPGQMPTSTSPPVLSYGIGSDVRVGDVRWKVLTAANEGQTLKSDDGFADDLTTAGVFVRVSFEMENLSKDNLTFSGIDLIDDQGRTFSASSDAYMFITDNMGCTFLDNLNPNIPKQCQVIFEVAPGATGLKVKVGDLSMFGDAEQAINLGL